MSSPDLFDLNGGSLRVEKIEKLLLRVKNCREDDDFGAINKLDLIYRIKNYIELYKGTSFSK